MITSFKIPLTMDISLTALEGSIYTWGKKEWFTCSDKSEGPALSFVSNHEQLPSPMLLFYVSDDEKNIYIYISPVSLISILIISFIEK